MNRYKVHTFQRHVPLIIMTFNKWTGETFVCCPEGKWENWGIPKEPTTTFIRLDEPKEPTTTIRFEPIEPTPTN